MQSQPKLQRKLRQLACAVAVPAIAAGSILGGTKPALAEFEIQEADIEKGEVEIEYRGAYHWGMPEVTEENENANDLVQSHEIELEMGISDWWLIQVTGGFDQALHENLQGSSVEIETEFAMIKRHGDGIALSFQLGYEQVINNHKHLDDGEASAFGFGPIVEVASGKFLLTLNPVFNKQIGTFADQQGLGFEYGWRGEYDFAKHWGVGVEMFGEIEDLSNPGSFNDQNHSIGPTLFWNPSGGENDDETAGKGDDNDETKGKSKEPEPPETSFSMNVGYQFGLTDATSDGALKFQGSLSF